VVVRLCCKPLQNSLGKHKKYNKVDSILKNSAENFSQEEYEYLKEIFLAEIEK